MVSGLHHCKTRVRVNSCSTSNSHNFNCSYTIYSNCFHFLLFHQHFNSRSSFSYITVPALISSASTSIYHLHFNSSSSIYHLKNFNYERIKYIFGINDCKHTHRPYSYFIVLKLQGNMLHVLNITAQEVRTEDVQVNPVRHHSFVQTAAAALTAGRASDGDWPHGLFVCCLSFIYCTLWASGVKVAEHKGKVNNVKWSARSKDLAWFQPLLKGCFFQSKHAIPLSALTLSSWVFPVEETIRQ